MVLSPHPLGEIKGYDDARHYGSFYPFISGKDYGGLASGVFPDQVEQYDITEFLVYVFTPFALLFAARLWFSGKPADVAGLTLNEEGLQSGEITKIGVAAGRGRVRKNGIKWGRMWKIFGALLFTVGLGWGILAQMIRNEDGERARREAWFKSGFGTFPAPQLPEIKPHDLGSILPRSPMLGLELWFPTEMRRVEKDVPQDRLEYIADLEGFEGQDGMAIYTISRCRLLATVSDVEEVHLAEVNRLIGKLRSDPENTDIVSEIRDADIEGATGKICNVSATSGGKPLKISFLTMTRSQTRWLVMVASDKDQDLLLFDQTIKSIKLEPL